MTKMKNNILKTCNCLLLGLLLIFKSQYAGAQDHNYLTLRYGILKHLPSKIPNDLKHNWQTSSNTFEIIYDRALHLNENYKLNIGVGFSIFRFANSNLFYDRTTIQSNYVMVKYGLSRRLYSNKFFVNLDIFHYILPRELKQDVDQRRVFTNIEMGISYNINNRFRMSVSSPFTLFPFFLIRTSTGNMANNEPITIYNSKVLSYGVNFGCTYIF